MRVLSVAMAAAVFCLPVMAADFNGDGKDDIAIFRPSSGLWAIRGITRAYFGGDNDEPVPGDHNGDGVADLCIYRNTIGLWAIRGVTRVYFGGTGDVPVIGGGGSLRQPLPKTGQTIYYRTGDDGYCQKGLNVLQDNGDGTVTDIRTGLMWPIDRFGPGCAGGELKTWDNAIDWANNLIFANYDDWRLPNINELKSFWEVDWGHNSLMALYWSSSTVANYTSEAWAVDFGYGGGPFGKSNALNVRAVRGGE